MSRPTYETAEHLENERNAIEQVEACWGVVCKKTPQYYKIDYTVISPSGFVVGWAEVRGKNFARENFKTFFTSLEKAMTLVRYEALTKMPALLVIAWTDGVFCYRLKVQDLSQRQIRWDGRTVNSRGDFQDIEPVIHIPVSEFTKVSAALNPWE